MLWVIVMLKHLSMTHLQCPGWGLNVCTQDFPVLGPIHLSIDPVWSCSLCGETFPENNASSAMLNDRYRVLEVQVRFFSFRRRQVELMPKISIFVSSDHNTFFQISSELSRCSFANFRRACTCIFLSRRTLRLQIVLLVTMVADDLRSSTNPCHEVLGCSLIFLIRFTPLREILRGAQDWRRWIVKWCLFYFLIIAPTVDSFSPTCLPIVLETSPVPFW